MPRLHSSRPETHVQSFSNDSLNCQALKLTKIVNMCHKTMHFEAFAPLLSLTIVSKYLVTCDIKLYFIDIDLFSLK
jgi:hypothetical protein